MRVLFKFIVKPLCIAACLSSAAAAYAADNFPSKPIRMVTAFGAGSASDIVARMLGERLGAVLGQPVIVENKPGASGQVASDFVSRAEPDGYTLMLATNTTHSSNPYLFKTLRYDPIKDFTPLVQVCNFPFVLVVSTKLGVNDVKGLLAYAKSHSSTINYAYGNSTGQIAASSIDKMGNLGADAIPYKSTPQAMTDVIGGRTAFMFVDLASAAGQIDAGSLKALAVSTEQRSALAPNLPTVSESLGQPGFDLAAWVGIFGPAMMPPAVSERLSAELFKIVSSKEVQDKLTQMGAEPTPFKASAFGPFVERQKAVWGEKVKQSGIQPQ